MTAIRFATEDGLALEGELRQAAGAPRGTAVLCHPHPRHGGSKDHPVLWALQNELAGHRGLTVLAFNFRGVMGSEGRYGGDGEEVRDVAAAVKRVQHEAEGPTLLVGWSFGAWMALRLAVSHGGIAGLVLMGIPLGLEGGDRRLPTLGELESVSIPVLLVAGDADPLCPSSDLGNLAGWIPGAATWLVEGTDHFFGRREREVAARIGEWAERSVLAGRP